MLISPRPKVDELNKLRIDKRLLMKLKTMGNIASSLLEGGVAGAASVHWLRLVHIVPRRHLPRLPQELRSVH